MEVSVEVEYRSAFEEFSRKAQQVQLLTEHPNGDRKAFETALLELEKAHLAYNECARCIRADVAARLGQRSPPDATARSQ